DGSVRDGLSLLDQAMALSDGMITQEIVRKMLGRADTEPLESLLHALIAGDAAKALSIFDQLLHDGCDPIAIFQDLLRLTHHLTLAKSAPAAFAHHVDSDHQQRLQNLGADLSIPTLTRLWQMLLKGAQEIGQALDGQQAGHMILIRVCYLANAPTPQQILTSLETTPVASGSVTASSAARPMAPQTSTAAMASSPAPEVSEKIEIREFRDLLKLLGQKKEMLLQTALTHDAHLVAFEPGRLELRLKPAAPKDLITKLQALLPQLTGQTWTVSGSQAEGQPTFAEQRREAKRKIEAEVVDDPLVKAALEAFPGSQIQKIDHHHEEELY
ncbi:MAG: DNA polymerase III subunit gamma/tau, partial [Holosporales bacterium]